MVDIIKQDMTYIWAVSGDVTAPSDVKIQEGWAVEAVPRQWWNWMQNRADSNIAYMLQKGIPEWDATTEYLANKSFVSRSGIVYKSILTGTNQDPVSAPTYWVRAFQDYTAASNALGSVTPSADTVPYFTNGTTASTTALTPFARTILDDADASAVRTTISAQALDATLTAIAGAATGANILHYFTGTDTVATTTLTAFGRSLIDDADATAARTTLGLSTGATSTVTTSQTDSTANRLLKVGDFGLGNNNPPSLTDVNDLTIKTGFYATSSTTTNVPAAAAGAFGELWHLNINDTAGHQLFFSRSGSAINTSYFRTASGGAWSPWNELYNTGNFDPATKQPLDATLTALAGLTTAADRLPYFTGVDTSAVTIFTAFARTLLDDGDAATMRSTLGLGTAATATLTTSQNSSTSGQVVKVGDYSLGAKGGTLNPSIINDDLNNAPCTGFFYTNTATNNPAGVNGYLLHQESNSTGAAFQMYSQAGDSTPDVWIRQKATSTWGSWYRLYSTQNVSAFAQTLLDDADAATARGTLGLGTAATQTVTTSTTDNTTGRVMRIGDFGFGSGNAINTDGTNLNTLTNTGVYNVSNPVNGPTSATQTILVIGNDVATGRTVQISHSANSEDHYVRSNSSGTWTAWKELLHTANTGTSVTFDVTTSTVDTTNNALLKVSDFGVGALSLSTSTSIANLNNINLASGTYAFSGGSTGAPTSQAGTLIVHRYSSGAMRQLVLIQNGVADNTEVWTRNVWTGPTYGTWTKLYSQSSILGTVSQSGGVPTGAVIERGSNANGEYVKFADGTMICTISDITTASITANNSAGSQSITFPATFAAVPRVHAHCQPTGSNDQYGVTSVQSRTTSSALIVLRNGGTAQTFTVWATVVGRWF